MTSHHVDKTLGYTATYYRDKGYKASRGIYVSLKQVIWIYLISRFVPKIADLSAIYGYFRLLWWGNWKWRVKFWGAPYFPTNRPIWVPWIVPMNFLVFQLFYLWGLQKNVPVFVMFPHAPTLQVLLPWHSGSLLPPWPEYSSTQGIFKQQKEMWLENQASEGWGIYEKFYMGVYVFLEQFMYLCVYVRL